RQVARDGEAANVFVNSADDPANCAFILPSVVTRGDLQVAVSTNGRSPALARWARRHLESVFTDVHARTLDLLSDVRDELRRVRGASEVAGWDGVTDDALSEPGATHRLGEARRRVRPAVGLEGVTS